MQNQLNLMSSFEFISILMSIIIGLGVTNLLAGAGRAFYRRRQNPMDEVHIVLTIATLLVLVLNWWVVFKWNNEAVWSFDKFLVPIVWTIALYMLTIFHPIYPKRKNIATDSNRIALVTILHSSRSVCSTSHKRQFAATCFIRFGTFRSSGNTRFRLAAASLPSGVATIDFSRGTN